MDDVQLRKVVVPLLAVVDCNLPVHLFVVGVLRPVLHPVSCDVFRIGSRSLVAVTRSRPPFDPALAFAPQFTVRL